MKLPFEIDLREKVVVITGAGGVLCSMFAEALAKTGAIQNCCQLNALMTLKEYLTGYASPETKAVGDKLIAKELDTIPNEKVRKIVIDNLRAIEEDNRRDFRF